MKKRGVALKGGQSLEGLYAERVPLYEKYADLVMECEGRQIRQIVAQIVEMLPQKENPGRPL